MRRLLSFIPPLILASSLYADWDYQYLTLDELKERSSFIVVAEIKAIEEKIEGGRVVQSIHFVPVTPIKGRTDPKGFKYHASYIPKLCEPPESFYIGSPPGTKYLLFLTKIDDAYVSVLGPCGALPVNAYLTDRVLWYTDESKAQRFADHWKEKPLTEVIERIKAEPEKTDSSDGG